MSSSAPLDQWIECPGFAVTQPIGTFLVARMRWQDLKEIVFADIRRVISNQGSELGKYVGIQRELSPGRVKEIAEYVNTVDATFPNSIIVAVRQDGTHDTTEEGGVQDSLEFVPYDQDEVSGSNIEYLSQSGTIRLRRHERLAKIIDGQHRIAGLLQYAGEQDFELIVTIYVDMDIADQALVFATINKAQTKVNKSLVYDLYAYARTRSPQRTMHNIAVTLNQRELSPFHNKIKRLGKADGVGQTITQATFVEAFVPFISDNPIRDADVYKRGKKPLRGQKYGETKLFFRPWFIEEKDELIARVIIDYFSEVARRWQAWDEVETGNILNRSTGFLALVGLMSDIFKKRDPTLTPRPVLQEAFRTVLGAVDLESEDFKREAFIPGSAGRSALLARLRTGLKTLYASGVRIDS